MNSIPKTVAAVTDHLRRNTQSIMGDKLRKMILYGSYARGDYKDYSDLDIMILADVSDNEQKAFENQIHTFASDIGLEHDIIISVIINNESLFMSRLHISPFYRNVLLEGVELYAAH